MRRQGMRLRGLTMPPLPVWFGGHADIRAFLDDFLFKSFHPFRLRLVPIRANGSPAFAAYQLGADGLYHAAALHILSIENGQISEINDYLSFDGQLFKHFHLDLVL